MVEQQGDRPRRFLSLSEAARRLGVARSSLYSRSDLPVPDVMVGPNGGWDAERLDAWWAEANHSPGRPRKNEGKQGLQ